MAKLKSKLKTYSLATLLGLGVFSINMLFSSHSYATTPAFLQEMKVEKDPNVFFRKTSENLFTQLKSQQNQINKNPNILKNIIKSEVSPFLNTKYAASLILGQYYKLISEQEREQFFKAFDKYIETTYAQIFTLYTGQKVEYDTLKYNGKDKVVNLRALVDNNGQKLKVNFSLRQNSKTNEWQIYDIVAEGVSLIQSKKVEWGDYFRNNKVSELTKELEKLSQKDIVKK